MKKQNSDILNILESQKKKLIAKDPQLSSSFVSISLFPELPPFPFLPIGCFREFNLYTNKETPSRIFRSSGTTNATRAVHGLSSDAETRYKTACTQTFKSFLHDVHFSENALILSLVPPLDVWPGSSLAFMMNAFRENGLHVQYVNAEEDVSIFNQFPKHSHVILFGTSFHHLQALHALKSNPIKVTEPSTQLLIIDTGGTKGKTTQYPREVFWKLIESGYGNLGKLQFASEYGMCELTSQAYATDDHSAFQFKTAENLFCYAIDPFRDSKSSSDKGFLAFIDLENQDSYPAIITEDLATCLSNQKFILHGRSPQASVKGCSLHVSDDAFRKSFSLPSSAISFPPGKKKWSSSDLIASLSSSIWTPYEVSDLQKSLNNLNSQSLNCALSPHKSAAIICSANIPITWLFPVLHLDAMGIKQIDIKLPQPRAEDEQSNLVRQQIKELARFVSQMLQNSTLQVIEYDPLDKVTYDLVLAFGSNSTLDSIQQRLSPQTKFVPQGEINNGLRISTLDEFTKALSMCSAWNGRGCLTPQVIVLGNDFSETDLETWSEQFEKEMDQRGAPRLFSHLPWQLNAWMQNYKEELSYKLHEHTLTINVTKIKKENISKLPQLHLGAGNVLMIREEQLCYLKMDLEFFNPYPTLLENHADKTWQEMLSFN